MSNKIKNILGYSSLKVEVDPLKISEVLIKELMKFNFEEDYLKEGDLQIENASEITFNSCVIENYTETRSISESNRPNRSGVPQGSKRISEFNVWDYKLSFDKQFQNSTDKLDILESHHAIGCGTCKQQGNIRCSSCRGAGDLTCSSCNGRGEKQCGNCNGRVDIKCWSCSGKGTQETGYGENKRTERCSSCSGRGSNKCTSCSNGFVTCSTCSGDGKVTCYTCYGSGEVTCYQCDGHRTMDHFFIVSANFINLSQTLYLTNPYPGFDQNKSKTSNFNIQIKLFDIQEPRFKESHFDDIKSSPFYRQITSFLDFPNNGRTKLIASRITCFENKYFEVTFNFYGSKYTIFIDRNFENSYYSGKKPSDQYELDLLKKAIDSSVKNELNITKKTIQKISKYDFISISEKEIISAIEDTENIYDAHTNYKNKYYTAAENSLRLVSDSKKIEEDYKKLRDKLNKVYLINTAIIGLVASIFIWFYVFDKNYEFRTIQGFISLGIILICLLYNRVSKDIKISRLSVLALLFIQFFAIIYLEKNESNKIESEENLLVDFNAFKNKHYTVFSSLNFMGPDSIILIRKTGNQRRNYFLPKGKPYTLDFGNGQDSKERISEGKMYLNIEQKSFESSRRTFQVKVALRTKSEFVWYVSVKYDDVKYDDNDNEVEVEYIFNGIDYYKNNEIRTMYLSNELWNSVLNGLKNLDGNDVSNNDIPLTKKESNSGLIEVQVKNNESIIENIDTDLTSDEFIQVSVIGLSIKGAKLKKSPDPLGDAFITLNENQNVTISDYNNNYFNVCIGNNCGFVSEVWIKDYAKIIEEIKILKKNK